MWSKYGSFPGVKFQRSYWLLPVACHLSSMNSLHFGAKFYCHIDGVATD